MSHFSSRQHLARHLYAFTVGIAAGGTVGAVGWGGAQVLIPGMTWNHSLAGYSQLTSTGFALTSLSTSVLTSGYEFYEQNQVDVPIALMIGIPAMLSARLGTAWAKRLSGDALALIFNSCSILLLPTHFWIQERAKLRHQMAPNSTPVQLQRHSPANISQQEVLRFAPFGLFQGILSSLMGVGGLPLVMSYLTETTQLDHHCIQGTAICATVPSILTSAVSRLQVIPLFPAVAVCVGAIAGGYGGAHLALALDNEELRILYMSSLLLFGGRSALGAASNLRQILKSYLQKKPK